MHECPATLQIITLKSICLILLELLIRNLNIYISNIFDSVDAVLAISKTPLDKDFCKQSDIHSPWNVYSMKVTLEGGGIILNDSVFGQQ